MWISQFISVSKQRLSKTVIQGCIIYTHLPRPATRGIYYSCFLDKRRKSINEYKVKKEQGKCWDKINRGFWGVTNLTFPIIIVL